MASGWGRGGQGARGPTEWLYLKTDRVTKCLSVFRYSASLSFLSCRKLSVNPATSNTPLSHVSCLFSLSSLIRFFSRLGGQRRLNTFIKDFVVPCITGLLSFAQYHSCIYFIRFVYPGEKALLTLFRDCFAHKATRLRACHNHITTTQCQGWGTLINNHISIVYPANSRATRFEGFTHTYCVRHASPAYFGGRGHSLRIHSLGRQYCQLWTW